VVEVTSILAIYILLWILSAFIMLPLGIKTHDEAGLDKVPGQADSAPANFRPGRVALRATILSAILCALYFANYHFGWITAQDINLYGNGPQADEAVNR
jgi:predicted secreted protein